MIIKMNDLIEKWTVILAASWINETNRSEMFNYVREVLLANLSDEEKMTIGGISLIGSNHHMVQLFTKAVRVTEGSTKLQDTQLNGYKINEAYIFESLIPAE